MENNKAMFYVFEVISMVLLGIFLYYAYMFLGGELIWQKLR